MALIVCPECKTLFSEFGANCPKCACPIEIVQKEHSARLDYLEKRKESKKLEYEAEALRLIEQSELEKMKLNEEIEKTQKRIEEAESKIEQERSRGEKKKEENILSLKNEYSILEEQYAEQKDKKRQLESEIASTKILHFAKKRALKDELTIVEDSILKIDNKLRAVKDKIVIAEKSHPSIPSNSMKEKAERKLAGLIKKSKIPVLTEEEAMHKVMSRYVKDSGLIKGYSFNSFMQSEMYEILGVLGIATIPQMIKWSSILEYAEESMIDGVLGACIKYNNIKRAETEGSSDTYYTKVSAEERNRINEETWKKQQKELEEQTKKRQQELRELQLRLLKLQAPQAQTKQASVIGRGIVGAAIVGPTGAVIGALSAVDKNNRNDPK